MKFFNVKMGNVRNIVTFIQMSVSQVYVGLMAYFEMLSCLTILMKIKILILNPDLYLGDGSCYTNHLLRYSYLLTL